MGADRGLPRSCGDDGRRRYEATRPAEPRDVTSGHRGSSVGEIDPRFCTLLDGRPKYPRVVPHARVIFRSDPCGTEGDLRIRSQPSSWIRAD
jgi:hypothetical protein